MAHNYFSARDVKRVFGNTAVLAGICFAAAISTAQEIRVQKTSGASNSASLNIEVVNTTASSMSNLKAQYFLDHSDHGSELVVEVDHTSAASLTRSVVKVNDNLSVVTFDLGSESIPAGAKRSIAARLHLASWGPMDFTNDYSFLGLGATMAVASRLALLQGTTLVFGTPPSGLGGGATAASNVVITNPSRSIVVSKATIPVEWTVDGKRQLSETQEDLQPGPNLVFRCFEGSCAAVEVYRIDAPHSYEASVPAPDWNGDLVSVRALTDLAMSDRAVLRGTRVLVGGSFSEGFDAKLTAALEVDGNIVLKDRAALHGSYALGGATTFGTSVQVAAEKGAYTAPTTAMPTVPVVTAGNEVVFASGMLLMPGKYASLLVPQGATLVLSAGSYSFTSLTFVSDAKLVIEGLGAVVVDVNKLVVGDRVVSTFRNSTQHGDVTFRSSQSEQLSIGYDSRLECDLLAPQAAVTLQDRATWNGSIWAKSIVIGSDAVVDGRGAAQGILDAVVKRIGSDGLENLRMSSARGVLHVSSSRINLMKRSELLPIWGDSGFTYLDDMGLSRSYAPYELEFSPKSPFFLDEGLKLAASDAVVVGSETIAGVDCWKVRISRYIAPWYFLAHFPEFELMSADAVVWFAKDGDRVVRIDLSVDDPRLVPFAKEGVTPTPIGKVTYRIDAGECSQLPHFTANESIVRYKVVVKADGTNTAGTGLSEIEFYQNGSRVSPILSAAGSSVTGRKIILGSKGDRLLPDAWKLFNGDGVDDGFLDPSTVGDYDFVVEFAASARPDEIRVSGPSDAAAGPTSIEVLASSDGVAWKTIGKDESLSWQTFEIKSRPLFWDRLARTCVPRSLDVSIPGLSLDANDVGFQNWTNLRTSTEIIDLHRGTVNSQILPLPQATEIDYQRKYTLLAAYKKQVLEPWFGLFWQVRSGMAAGGAGAHLDFAVQEEVGLPVEYFRLNHDLPKVTP